MDLHRIRLTGRKLGRERGGAAERVVLPRDGAASELRHRVVREPGDAREDPLDPPVAARGPDHVEVLVEPDRHARAQSEDQPVRDARLALGQRVRPRRVDAADRPPVPREVPVQVDPVRVAARAGGDAVGVEVGDDPEVDAAWREPLQRPRDRRPRGLVAVDRADDEHARSGPVADLDGVDRPAEPGAPEQDGATGRGRHEAEERRRRHRHRVRSHGHLLLTRASSITL